MQKALFVLIVFFSTSLAIAQQKKILTLEECIQSALDKNLRIKRSVNNLALANSNKKQAVYNFLPDLNARINYSYTDGSDIDQNGDIVSSSFSQSRPIIASNFLLFNAFANHHLLNQRKHELSASENQLENDRIFTTALVLRNYLNVLLDTENLRISSQRLELLENQLERERKRESVGVGSLESVYNFQSQVATERLNNVTLENRYRSDLLGLLQVIQLNDSEHFFNYSLEPLSVNNDTELLQFDEFDMVLEEIIINSYQLKSSDDSQKASEFFMKQAVSSRYPTLQVDASHSRNYSSFNEIDFIDQMQNFPTDFVQATVNIPIFNRYQTQNRIESAKVSLMNSQLDYEQALIDVTNAAQSDYLDLRAAQTQYITAIDNFEALNETFAFSKKRFETGNTDFYTYLQALNNKNSAEAQLANAKYSIVLRKRILDLYRGN